MKENKPVPSELYTGEYFLTNCTGYKEFMETKGKKLIPRLKDVLNLAQIRPGMKIIDLGCGRGELILHALHSGATVTGIDYSTNAIKLAKEAISLSPDEEKKRITLINGDVKDINYSDNTFDIVFMTDLVEHLYPEELQQVFCKTYNMLRKGGKLIIHTAPNIWYTDYAYKFIRQVVLFKEFVLGTKNVLPKIHHSMIGINEIVHVNLQNPRSLRKNLKKSSFNKTKIVFNEEGPMYGKNILNRVINSIFQLYPLKLFFNLCIYAVAEK